MKLGFRVILLRAGSFLLRSTCAHLRHISSSCFFSGTLGPIIDDHNAGSRRDTLRTRERSGIASVDTVGIVLDVIVLDGLIALRGNVWLRLALVLGEACKTCTEQKSCKNELSSFSVKPHKGDSSCGNHVERPKSPQCMAGKIAVNPGSTEDQVVCIEWFWLKRPEPAAGKDQPANRI
jgi:hypothetical protein